MELYGECFFILVLYALAGTVIGVDEGDLGIITDRIVDYGIAVVLAGDVDSARLGIGHRLVRTSVAVFELRGLSAVSKSIELMSEADSKCRDIHRNEFLELLDDLGILGGVSRAVGEHDAVGSELGDSFSLSISGNDSYLAAALNELSCDAPLGAEIKENDLSLGLALCGEDILLIAGGVLDCVLDGIVLQVIEAEARALADDLAVHNTRLADDLGELSGVDTAETDDIILL